MDKIVSKSSNTNWDHKDKHGPGTEVEEFLPLTAQQAQELRAKNPSVSPWGVVAGQLVVGVLVASLSGLLTGKVNVFWSAAYGALAVVLPAAVFARGLTGRLVSINPGAAVFGFFLWEMVKIGLTVAMLFAAPRLVSELSWPAMLVGLVVTIKVYWVALAFRKKNVINVF
jgi:ATP synthase protein I